MNLSKFRIFPVIIAVFVVIFILPPAAAAANNSISIGYSGSGGSYIGDMVFFSGKYSDGATVGVRISGPGLPSAGVPIYNLSGQPGTGTPIQVGSDGRWKFLWYSASTQGIEKLQTARYTFTVFDPVNPDISSSTSILLKKPEFTVTVNPNPSLLGEYVAIAGNAELDTSTVRIIVSDQTGAVYHSFTSPVGADGSFNFGFHGDMQPGRYSVTVSDPSLRSVLNVPMIVVATRAEVNSTDMTNESIPLTGQPGTGNTALNAGTGSLTIISTPSNASVMIDSAMAGYTPLEVANIAPGSHQIGISYPGYLTYSAGVTVVSGQQVNLSPALTRNPSSVPVSPITAILALVIIGACIIAFIPGKKT